MPRRRSPYRGKSRLDHQESLSAAAGVPRTTLAVGEIETLEPSRTKRAQEQLRFQQFSTPSPLAHAALRVAALRPGDIVLEPSADTAMLAVMAKCSLGTCAAGSLNLNETARVLRTGLNDALFPGPTVTPHNAGSEVAREPHILAVEALALALHGATELAAAP